jgi:hypothetical protein
MRYVLIAVLFSSAAWADPSLECFDAGSQVEIGACVGEMEKRVNMAVEAQEAWRGYRDAQCEAVGASYGGGSGTGIAIASCRVDLGRARVDELLRMAN